MRSGMSLTRELRRKSKVRPRSHAPPSIPISNHRFPSIFLVIIIQWEMEHGGFGMGRWRGRTLRHISFASKNFSQIWAVGVE